MTEDFECESFSKEEFDSNEIDLYPNPTSQFIEVRTNYAINQLKLYSISGKEVKSYPKNISRIDLSDLPNGIYLLEIVTNQGSITKKIIKN